MLSVLIRLFGEVDHGYHSMSSSFSAQDLRRQLSQCEPRVASLREIAEQVFARSATAESGQLRSQLILLSERLTSLSKICSHYCQLLEGARQTEIPSLSRSSRSLTPATGSQRAIIALSSRVSWARLPVSYANPPPENEN